MIRGRHVGRGGRVWFRAVGACAVGVAAALPAGAQTPRTELLERALASSRPAALDLWFEAADPELGAGRDDE